jgi:two-component sensor histidine kinase
MRSYELPHSLAPLREIARALSSAWDLDTTLHLISLKTTEVMNVDSCTLYLLDPDGQTLRLRASTGLARRALGRATLQVGEGMTGYAVAKNQPVYSANAHTDPHFKWVDEAEEMGFKSLLAVPLVIENQPLGALNIQTVTAREFTAGEVEMLSFIGDLAAGALAKAQLYDRQKRQIDELQALAQVSEAAIAPQYLDDMLDVVTDMVAKLVNAAACAIFLLDETGQHLVMHSAQRITSPYQPRPPLPIGAGLTGSVARTGKPAYSADVRTDHRYAGRELARAEGLVSLLAVPLIVRERVIGVMNTYTNQVVEFPESQRTLLATLANQTALAIENIRLVTNAAIVREMHHRIKNNLQTVAMLMQMQMVEADRLDTREVLQANINRIQSIATVHEALSEKGFKLVDVRDVLQRISRSTAAMLATPARFLDIQIQGEALLLPSRAATSLTLVVNELLQNALEHAFQGRTSGRVVINLGRSPEEIIVLVQDDGIGLPQEHTPGLGLEIAETLVQDDLRGRIKFNRLPQGTEVSIRLPRSLEQEME